MPRPRLQERYLSEKIHSSPTEGPIRSQTQSALCRAAPLHPQSPFLRERVSAGEALIDAEPAMPARQPRRPWHWGSADSGGLGELSQQCRWGLCGQASFQDSLSPCPSVPPCSGVLQNRDPLALCTGEPTQRQDTQVMGSQSYIPLARGVSAHHDALKHHPQSRNEPRCSLHLPNQIPEHGIHLQTHQLCCTPMASLQTLAYTAWGEDVRKQRGLEGALGPAGVGQGGAA